MKFPQIIVGCVEEEEREITASLLNVSSEISAVSGIPSELNAKTKNARLW